PGSVPGLLTTRRRRLQPTLEDLEVALLRLDDVVQQCVDRRDLPVLVELVIEGGELRVVLEAEDLHEVVGPAAVLVDRDVAAADREEQGLQLPHEVEELAAAPVADGVRDGQDDPGLREVRRDQRPARRSGSGLARVAHGRHRTGRTDGRTPPTCAACSWTGLSPATSSPGSPRGAK